MPEDDFVRTGRQQAGRCDEPYVREEVLERLFSDLVGRLIFDDEVLGFRPNTSACKTGWT